VKGPKAQSLVREHLLNEEKIGSLGHVSKYCFEPTIAQTILPLRAPTTNITINNISERHLRHTGPTTHSTLAESNHYKQFNIK
jgi:hypothetical protein